MTSRIGTLAYEFPYFPAESLSAIPPSWESQHWHNDSAPSWKTGFWTVYVGEPDSVMREWGDGGRFIVLHDCYEDCSPEFALQTDNWGDVLNLVTLP